MTQESFRYPGNSYDQFSKLLGLITENVGDRVVVRPEQWEHSKCYGVTRLSKLQHYLELALYKYDGSVAFSYRDFCFSIMDNRFSNLQQECAQTICNHAKGVAARIQVLFPNMKVSAEVGNDDTREQRWSCEKCKATGSVKHEQRADVMSVVYLIEDDHKRVSPECNQPVRGIRLVKAEVVS